MKPVDVKSNAHIANIIYCNSSKKTMIKILSLKLVILLEFQNIKKCL